MSGGALPLQDAILLGLGKFNKILEIDYENKCVVTQPGVTNLGITHAVQHKGFYYAPDPSSQLACSIGGNVAENSGGVHSLKYGATNPQAIRGYQQLGNLVKGIANLLPGKTLMTGLLNKIPGINLAPKFSMTEINPFNIGPGFAQYPDQFTRPFTNPELEAMTNPAIYDRLFNDVAPVQTGMFSPMTPITPMQRPMQPIQSVTETTNMPGMEGIPDMSPDNQGVPTYDFNKIINGDYYEQDPRSLGSGSLPASEMGAFSNMQNTNTFNLFNPDTYPTFGEVMFGSNYGK